MPSNIDHQPLVVRTRHALVFDENNPLCQLIEQRSDGDVVLFIQCIDERSGFPKRYWGVAREPSRHDSVQRIMDRGSKWPTLPGWDNAS